MITRHPQQMMITSLPLLWEITYLSILSTHGFMNIKVIKKIAIFFPGYLCNEDKKHERDESTRPLAYRHSTVTNPMLA